MTGGRVPHAVHEFRMPAEEDPHAKWEWELSGQLRFSCRRAPNGFGGAAAFSSLVLGSDGSFWS